MREPASIPLGWELHKAAANGGSIFRLTKNERRSDVKVTYAPREPQVALKRDLKTEIDYRDRGYRIVARQFGNLGRAYRQELIDRGLTDPEIDELERDETIFNWVSDDRINRDVTDLPGIDGKWMTTRQGSGMAIACKTAAGKIAGAQLMPVQMTRRSRAIAKTIDPNASKYYWLSSSNMGGPGPSLPNDKLPLNCYVPHHPVHSLFLCEGTLKPVIAGVKLNRDNPGIAVLGASGAQFAVRQVMEAIEVLGVKRVVLCPDSNSLTNPNICREYHKIIDALQHQPFNVEIANWDQFEDKLKGDIDELDDFSQIRYTTNLSILRIESPIPDIKSDSSIYTSEIDDWRNFNQKERLLALVMSADDRAKERFLPVEPMTLVLKQGNFVAIKSAMGTGKTHRLVELCQRAKLLGLRMIFVGYRNQLLRSIADRIPDCYVIVDDPLFCSNYTDHLLLCHHSLSKLNPEMFENSIVVFDEAAAIMTDMCTTRLSSVARCRASHFQLLKERLNACHSILLLDANLNDSIVDMYALQIEGREWVKHVYHNTYVRPMNIELAGDSSTKARDLLTVRLVDLIVEGKKVLVTADSKGLLQSILTQLETKIGKKTNALLVHQETANEPLPLEFITNPNRFIEKHQPVCVLLSPTGESGLDISTPYFEFHFHFHSGVTSIDSLIQFLGRERNLEACPKILWIGQPNCKNLGYQATDRAWDSHEISSEKFRTFQSMANKYTKLNEEDRQLYWRLYEDCELERSIAFAHRMLELDRQDFYGSSLKRLRSTGHSVKIFDLDPEPAEAKAASTEVKTAKAAVKLAIATEFQTMESTYNLKEAVAVIDNPTSTKACLLDARKSKFKFDYPGIDKSPVWSQIELWHTYANTDKIPKLESLFLISKSQVAGYQMHQNAIAYAQNGGRFEDLPVRPMYAYAANKAGLHLLINRTYQDGDPFLQDVIDRIVSCPILQAVPQGVQTDCEYIGKIAAAFGLKSKAVKRVRARDASGKVLKNAVRSYTLVPITDGDAILTEIYRAIERRYKHDPHTSQLLVDPPLGCDLDELGEPTEEPVVYHYRRGKPQVFNPTAPHEPTFPSSSADKPDTP